MFPFSVCYGCRMGGALRVFEMKRLFEDLDAARCARGMSWVELMKEINKPFEGTPSIPISLGTVKGMVKKRSVTSAVILQILGWLRRAPESFLSGNNAAPSEGEILPVPESGRILRFDTRAVHAAIDAERHGRGLTWKQVAKELPGFTETMLTNLVGGPLIGFPRVMLLTQWVGLPVVQFVRVHDR
jgi:hypothetical protein